MSAVLSPPPLWVIPERDRVAEQALMAELGIAAPLAALLLLRGYRDAASADLFLNPRLEDLLDPRDLPDFEPAISAILAARERKELIYVHGDYDVDGVTSTALFTRFLENIGCKVLPHVPHRQREGYGVHSSAVAAAKGAGARLFLTCDCGSGSIEEIRAAKMAGMVVVVTDHHTVGDEPLEADAFVNPHRKDSGYGFQSLCGVGIAFKLCLGICRELKLSEANYFRAFLDLVALGTIADVMPLIGENRIFAAHGLRQLRETRKPGLRALIKASGAGERLGYITPEDVGYRIGPRLNAAGRIDDAEISLRLLLTRDEAEAADLAETIEGHNRERKLLQDTMLEEAIEMVEALENLPHFIVVASEGWHPGVVGIVAGRLRERFYRPSLMVSIDADAGLCKGSARSIPGFHLAEAIWSSPLMTGGGHAAAAGCGFKLSDIEEVKAILNNFAIERIPDDALIPKVRPDLCLDPGELNLQAVEELARLEPCGDGNPTPRFASMDVDLVHTNLTKDGNHVQLKFSKDGCAPVDSIMFGASETIGQVPAGAKMNVLYRAELDEYNGRKKVKWKLADYCLA